MKIFSKLANKIDNSPASEYKCTVRLLDDTETISCDFTKDTKGQTILDHVCYKLDLLEKDYFGLRYMENNKQRHWLDPVKAVLRQFKNVNPYVLCFRVRFYPPNPELLQEEITRYYLFLQLRRDLLHGRLFTNQTDGPMLAAYILQSEVGDYDPSEHPNCGYVSNHKLLMKQTPRVEEQIHEHHKLLKGKVPSEAEMIFLQKASELETYGIDPYPVKDQRNNHMYLGINHAGIMTFQSNNKVHHFKWDEIRKIEFEGKMLIIHLLMDGKKHVCGFKCPTQASCKHIWKCAIEQRDFFKLKSSEEIKVHHSGGGLFSRGSKYRYSGRVEKEISQAGRSSAPRIGPTVIRKSSLKEPPRKKGGTYFSDKAKPVTYHSPKMGDRSMTSSGSEAPLSPTIRVVSGMNGGGGSGSPDSYVMRGTSEKWISTPESKVAPKRPRPPTLSPSPSGAGEGLGQFHSENSALDSSLSFDEAGGGGDAGGPKNYGAPPYRPGPPPRPLNSPGAVYDKESRNYATDMVGTPMTAQLLHSFVESPTPPSALTPSPTKVVTKSHHKNDVPQFNHGDTETIAYPKARPTSTSNGDLSPTHHLPPSVKGKIGFRGAPDTNDDRLLREANLEMVKLQEDKTNHLAGPNVKLRLLNDGSGGRTGSAPSHRDTGKSTLASYLNQSLAGLKRRFVTGTGDAANRLPGHDVPDTPSSEVRTTVHQSRTRRHEPTHGSNTLLPKLVVLALLLVVLGIALVLLMESDNPNARFLFRKYRHLNTFRQYRYVPAKREVVRAWHRVCDLRN